jgi:hypothetical protein
MSIAERLEALELRTKHGWQLRRDLIRISGAGGDMSAQVATLSGILTDELGSPLGCDDYVHDLQLLIEGVSSALIETAQDRAHARFEARVAELKSRLSRDESVKFLESVLGVLRDGCEFWSDVGVDHARSVVDTALAVLRIGPQVTDDEQIDSDHSALISFFDYARDSYD